ncbi:hypothetical protein NIES4101_38410 [Calothrix sp. NIES-4101]|nr:hypothetical protein NIES4101_38410 [Calothrix sp. NIES-4101]
MCGKGYTEYAVNIEIETYIPDLVKIPNEK